MQRRRRRGSALACANRICLAGITYIGGGEGWLSLADVLDLASCKIVGWSMRDHMHTELPLSAINEPDGVLL